MYLNLIQIAESLGVSEKVVEDWIRNEGLPCIHDRNRLLFDRGQVADWAAARGLAAKTGFLALETPPSAADSRLESLLRIGGIWRDVAPVAVPEVFARIIATLRGATPPIRQLLVQRLHARGGVNFAPVGGGFAVPHLATRIALGRDSGVLALLFLREPLDLGDSSPDREPVTRLFFFIAPTPRAHLDLLGQLCRLLSRSDFRERLQRGATDAEIFQAVATADAPAPGTGNREVTP